MSSSPPSQEVELDDEEAHQEEETQDIDEDSEEEAKVQNTKDQEPEVYGEVDHGEVSAVKPIASKKRATGENGSREAGKSLLPFSRVQKIIRADKEIPIMARDATFLISLATEEFIKRICEASRTISERENRATVQYKDLAAVVRRADEFMFLEDIIAITVEPPKQPRQSKSSSTSKSTRLDQFMASREDEYEDTDIVMNEDGTMHAAGAEVTNHEFE